MEGPQREFLERLLGTPSPSGFEVDGQRVWIEYVETFANDVRTDEYGNAVAVHEGNGPEIVLAGHADEIGFIVRRIDEDGFVHLDSIGGADRTVSQGQYVTIHAASGPVTGVIGQAAIHLRDPDEEKLRDVTEQRVDIGVEDGDEAEELVDVGDPITVRSSVEPLQGTRLAAPGLDNRVGTWAAAEGLRCAVEANVDATVYAVSTIQEEVGLQGAKMVGFDLAPDAAIAIDVTHATDHPTSPSDAGGDLELGGGPVITRGSANHPVLVDLFREAATAAAVDVQLQAAGIRTGTDADAFYTEGGGTPSLNLGIPLRYMHTPVETVDLDDLEAVPELLGAFVDAASEYDDFGVKL